MTGNNITVPQIRCIKALIGKLHLQHQEESMLQELTQGRTTSVKELTLEEGKLMIQHLKQFDPEEQKAEKMRRKIISMAHEMAWHTEATKGLHPRYRKVDMKRLDAWMEKSSYLHKKLNLYRYSELPKLVTQFETVLKSFLKSI